MKKLLLALCTLMCAFAVSFAETVEFDLTSSGCGKTIISTPVTKSAVTITLSKGGNSNAPAFNSSDNGVRIYAQNTINVSAKGCILNKVTFYTKSAYIDTPSAKPGTLSSYDSDNQVFTWTPDESSPCDEFTFTNGGTKGNTPMKKITVEYTVDESVVASPVFSLEAGEIPVGSVVTISCATDGASIYYTLDDTDPTTESVLYSDGVTINESCTLKAIAVKNGVASSAVVSATYTTLATGIKKITWTISGVENATTTEKGMNLTATISPTDATGTWFAQNGTTSIYYGTSSGAQIGSGSTSFDGGTITLKDTSIPNNSEIQSILISSKAASSASFTVKVSVGGVTATNSATVNSTSVATYTIDNIKLNGNTIVLNVSGPKKAFYLSGIAIYYKEVEVDPGAAPTPEAPEFDVAAGIVDAGTVVHLTCATADVPIYYTTNGDIPTEESTLYTADGITINETVTITAAAINQGVRSDVVSAKYVCFKKEESATSATFDFSKAGLVSSPYVEYPTASASIDGVTFMSNDVTMNVDRNGKSNTEPKWFVSTAKDYKGQTEARIYKGNVVTFKNTAEKGLITFIVFNQIKDKSTNAWDDSLTASVDGALVLGENNDTDTIFTTHTFTPEVPADSIVLFFANNCVFSNVVVNYAFGEIPVLEDVSCSATSIEFTTAPDVKVYYQVKDEQVANSELAAEDWVVATEDAGIEGLDVAADDEIAIYQFTSPLVTAGKYLYVKPVNDQFTGKISVLTFDVPTGIDGVEADANAPVEYFNLQGIRIANPSRGIYVKRQGSAVTKVLVK